MRKYNYRTTVHIDDTIINLGFRAKLPGDFKGEKVRVQAIFKQRSLERRFPMEVEIVEGETGPQIKADALVELPYVFANPPRHKVNVIYAVWLGMEETILSDQPFPIQKDLFERYDPKRSKSFGKFLLGTMALPFLILKNYKNNKNKTASFKEANATVYDYSGYNYSPRQRNTDYFSGRYDHFVKQIDVKENNILFLSERLPEEGGNLAKVMELCRQDKDIFVSKFLVPKTVNQLSRKELRECARLCARARVIVLEDFYPQLHSLSIRPQTKIVQLWHACGVFKTFGYSRLGKPGVAPQSSMNHRNYDLVTVSSESVRGIYAEAFAVTVGKVKALGAPRTDVLFDAEYKEAKRRELYQRYPQLEGRKVILFAPTFRGDGNKDAYYPEDAFDINLFMNGFEEDVCCIVKHHPFVHQEIKVDQKYEDRVLDLTGKDHINDLMLISDLLITDYSSSVFEAVLLGIPMLFYAFDKEDYIRSRDFYCDYDSFAPGFVEEDFSKMTETAGKILRHETDKAADDEITAKRVQFFHDFLSALDGRSTERIVAYIKGEMLTKLVKRR